MGFVGNILLFVAMKEFCKSIKIDKVIVMVRVAHFFDSRCRAQYLNLIGPDFCINCPTFVSRDLELGGVPAVSPSTKKFFFDFNEIWYVDRGR